MKTSVVHVQLKKDTRNRAHLRPVSNGGELGLIQLGPSWDQNSLFYALIRQVEQRKGNRIIKSSGFLVGAVGIEMASPHF
jgi:hypothetical protein